MLHLLSMRDRNWGGGGLPTANMTAWPMEPALNNTDKKKAQKAKFKGKKKDKCGFNKPQAQTLYNCLQQMWLYEQSATLVVVAQPLMTPMTWINR